MGRTVSFVPHNQTHRQRRCLVRGWGRRTPPPNLPSTGMGRWEAQDRHPYEIRTGRRNGKYGH